jgi:hypothetical protein
VLGGYALLSRFGAVVCAVTTGLLLRRGSITHALLAILAVMYASDYPHGESHFPESVSMVLDWVMDAERKRKLLWDNAIRFYARAPVR